MTGTDVMIPDHERWDEFVDALSHAVICARTTDNARRVLRSMSGIDVERSLEALLRLGGRCDCEIVFAVAGLEATHA